MTKGSRKIAEAPYRKRHGIYRSKGRPKPGYIHTVRLRNFVTQNTSVGGVLSGYFNDDPSACYDWSSLSNLYDSYRIESLKIRFYPHFPNDTSTTTGYYPLYICYDTDTTASTPASRQEVLEYENCKIKNMYMPWSVKKLVPRVSAGQTAVYIDKDGYVDIANVRAFSSFRFYCDGLDISTDYGDFIIDLVVSFKNRR